MIPLHELNKSLFASMLPETHGVKSKKPGKKPADLAATEDAVAPQYTDEQLEILAAAGIADPAAADPQPVAAILGL